MAPEGMHLLMHPVTSRLFYYSRILLIKVASGNFPFLELPKRNWGLRYQAVIPTWVSWHMTFKEMQEWEWSWSRKTLLGSGGGGGRRMLLEGRILFSSFFLTSCRCKSRHTLTPHTQSFIVTGRTIVGRGGEGQHQIKIQSSRRFVGKKNPTLLFFQLTLRLQRHSAS